MTIRQANTRGFAPGTEFPLGFWNQSLQAWEHAGTGIVDPSGQWVETQVTHFSNFDLNFPMLFGRAYPAQVIRTMAVPVAKAWAAVVHWQWNCGPPPAIPTPPTRPDPEKPGKSPDQPPDCGGSSSGGSSTAAQSSPCDKEKWRTEQS